MKMFVVDTERDFSTIHSIEVTEGAYLMPKKTKGNFQDQSIQLLQLILKHRPEKLVFDEHGLGLGLKDRFVKLLEEMNIEFSENGTVTY